MDTCEDLSRDVGMTPRVEEPLDTHVSTLVRRLTPPPPPVSDTIPPPVSEPPMGTAKDLSRDVDMTPQMHIDDDLVSVMTKLIF